MSVPSASMPDTSRIFPFFKLPAELRIMIYEYLFTQTRWWSSGQASIHRSHQMPNERPYPGAVIRRKDSVTTKLWSNLSSVHTGTVLLRTNNQAYSEAMPVLYGNNKFRFDSMAGLKDFLSLIGPRGCRLLKYLNVGRYSQRQAHDVFKMLGDTIKLQFLTLPLSTSSGHSEHWHACNLVKAMHPFLAPDGISAAERKRRLRIVTIRMPCNGHQYAGTAGFMRDYLSSKDHRAFKKLISELIEEHYVGFDDGGERLSLERVKASVGEAVLQTTDCVQW